MKRLTRCGSALISMTAIACSDNGIATDEAAATAGSAVRTSTTFVASADATVHEASPSLNDGASPTLVSDDSPRRWTYVRFSLSGISGTVTSAKLRLYVDQGTTDAPRVYKTSSGWTEAGITWSNRPAPGATAIADRGLATAGTWLEYDISSAVSGTGSFDFVLVPTSTDGLYTSSREGAKPPQLVVTTDTSVSIPDGNLTANPSMETDASGWSGWQSNVTRVFDAAAPHGTYVAKVSRASGSYYTIDDAPDTVPSALAGESYEACAYVAAAADQTLGRGARVVLRERSSAGLYKETSSPSLTLSRAYQRTCVRASVRETGDVVDAYVQQDGAQSGDAFFVDVATLVRVASAPPTTGRIDKGVAFHCMWSTYDNARRAAVLDKLKAAGVTLVRIDMGWDGFQPNGPTEWNSWYGGMADTCVDYAAARGMRVLIVDYLTPAWARPTGTDHHDPPTDPQTYANFAKTLALRYGSKLAGIEVWNEPDPVQIFFKGTLDQYVGLLKATFPTVHGASTVPIVLGAPSSNDDGWIGKVYALGGGKNFDILATHPYQGKADAPPEQPDDGHVWWLSHFPAVKAVMDQYGDGSKPVWFTEFGWSSHPNTGGEANWNLGVTEAAQGDYLARSFAYTKAHFPNVKAMFWYNERNKQTGDVHQDNFGLLRTDLSTKPAYDALRNVSP